MSSTAQYQQPQRVQQPPDLHLLAIPRKLRDMIYRQFLLIDAEDGYIFHFETGKLRTATKKPIDLNLIYTCRQVTDEMRGLAFKTHTISFKTLYSHDLSFLAYRFRKFTRMRLDNGLGAMLAHILPLISPSTTQKINNHFGEDIMERFIRLLSVWRPAQNNPYRDDALAFNYNALRQTLKLAITDPISRHRLSTKYFKQYMTGSSPARGRFNVPLPEDALSVGAILDIERQEEEFYEGYQRALSDGLFIRRFSAAAAAIHFFKSIPSTTRSQTRTIIVHEDHASIGGSTDILGFVPFCVENSHLRVQQRNFPKVLSSHLAIFENNAVPEAISTVFVAEAQPEWTLAMLQRSLAEVTAWVKSVDPSMSNEDGYMRYEGRYICKSWLAVVQAMVNNENAGQVRFDFEVDPRLATVWSNNKAQTMGSASSNHDG
ncbi:hypothetical protein B0T18DRAFT_489457 [Schizothecium vesticola]|uniref:Uncharacterized protein n=1 Tax=Schizothecium vesticola TaxID=314040 RepID=A0AA40EX06_9PEZI|nr:hypothetical protein B0T18DRAFT_489457 [Schizothecium vesticola]